MFFKKKKKEPITALDERLRYHGILGDDEELKVVWSDRMTPQIDIVRK